MDSNSNDDSRKKRDSTDVAEGDATKSEEKTKKLRAAKLRPTLSVKDSGFLDQLRSVVARPALDLEDALQLLVRIGNDSDHKEYLSEAKWVVFRLGHAGDASQIASCYRKRKLKQNETDSISKSCIESNSANGAQLDDAELEAKLAAGLGDGGSLPAVFSLVADIVGEDGEDRVFGAVALLSSGWEDSLKALRVEFFYVLNDDKYSDISGVLERRMWLRLSSLAVMTSNQLIVAEGLAKNRSEVA